MYSGFNNFQHVHRAGLDADTAGDALGSSGHLGLVHQNTEGSGSLALAAADAELLVDHIDAGLRILRDGTLFASLGALAALDAGHGANLTGTLNDLDTGLIRMELLMEGDGTSTHALQAGHTGRTLFHH